MRRRDLEDSPIPSGNSAAAYGLLRLALLSGEARYEQAARGALELLYPLAVRHPLAFGHLLGAAGAMSALTAVLTITRGVIPPTINLETPDPECDLDYVPNIAREQRVRTAIANGFGFGGQNAVAAFRALA